MTNHPLLITALSEKNITEHSANIVGGNVMKYKIKILGLIMAACMLLVACGTPGSGTAGTDDGEDTELNYEGEGYGEIDNGGEGGGDGYEWSDDLLGEEAVEEDGQITIVVYQSNVEGDSLIATGGVIIESITPENVLQILIDMGELSSDVRLLSFNQSGGLIELDLSTEFNGFMAAQGSWGEFVALGSLVNTFLSAFNGDSILITVGGEVLATPHIGEMSEPMVRFEL